MAENAGLAVPTKLKSWRSHRKMTQEQLAAEVGLQAPSISQLETGKQGFTDKSLAALASALGCTPAQLLTQDPARPDSFVPFFEEAEKLEGEQRRHVMNVIAAALGKPFG